MIVSIPETALKQESIDVSKIEQFTKIYVDTGDRYHFLFAIVHMHTCLCVCDKNDNNNNDHDPKSRQLLAAILEATKFKSDQRIPAYTMYFWEHFLEPFLIEIKQMNPNDDVDDFSVDFERNWHGWPKWFVDNVIPQLTIVMVSNCEWPEDSNEEDADNLDAIHSHRWQCSDILAKIAKILSAQHLLEQFCKMLTSLVNTSNPSPKVNMQIEAILFAIRSNYKVYEKPKENETHPLTEVLFKNYRTRCTAITLIARHANFLNVRDETFDKCMQYVCQGFQNPKVSDDAAHCIASVCEEFCTEPAFIQKHWPTLLQLYERSFALSIHDACELTRGLVVVICALNHYEKAQQWLKAILDTPVKYLDTMSKNHVKELRIDEQRTITLLDIMKRISIIWKFCVFSSDFPTRTTDGTKLTPLLVLFFQKLWPYFKAILETYKVRFFFFFFIYFILFIFWPPFFFTLKETYITHKTNKQRMMMT
ncbi:hypothetical protein RFI_15641 [Reticulomyxa filosa]|uniref:Uncharacterized protein n=1 Tax=Reticulomyxa filosa TaxID=46433 RepID=X6N732_RETFI|nr:hypothetical protein RFI_15641 [Reticulomyxa filosa]|eukprot:ETO21559.1 hypothetical protein RFI_15641 [Reticulomyxa filosa]